jgi:hypothetical protein
VSTHTEVEQAPAPVQPESNASEDKRKHARFNVENQAVVNVLGSKETVTGQIADLSQSGFKLLLPDSFPVGEIIRAEVDDEVFVAVVCYSKKAKEGGFTIGTEMMHSIKRVHLDDLVGEWGASR